MGAGGWGHYVWWVRVDFVNRAGGVAMGINEVLERIGREDNMKTIQYHTTLYRVIIKYHDTRGASITKELYLHRGRQPTRQSRKSQYEIPSSVHTFQCQSVRHISDLQHFSSAFIHLTRSMNESRRNLPNDEIHSSYDTKTGRLVRT